MSALEQVIQMQNQGMTDNEINAQLQNEGVSPKEIQLALNQASIKNAISQPEETYQNPNQQMQPTPEIPYQEPYAQEQYQQEMPLAPQPQDYYEQTPQAYSDQNYYQQQGAIDPETISEIAEQVVAERLNEFSKKTGDIASFKNTIQDKVADIDERLKRIENTIDKLQHAIIGKIGEFGESTSLIHQDLENLHGTVSKLMNPLVDNINEIRRSRQN